MSFDKARAFLESKGYQDRIKVFDVSSATVALAAIAAGVEEARIAKSLTFDVDSVPVMVVCAGDGKVDNRKFKDTFQKKAKMLTYEEVSSLIGHEVGGVCPFGVNDGVKVYLDESLKRFETVFPACGSSNSAVELTPDEFFDISGAISWVDVCKL